ncbi:MAG: tyrosine-type recombinase/integrase [Lachnospiraceae bacterium]|nr:tyrosine-type recombinase/integrase [Lachnospiraceae bacterium]
MRRTMERKADQVLTVDIESLAAMLSCGKAGARKIAEQAGARVTVGRRITIYDMDLASLREQERKITKDLDDKLVTDTAVKKLTLNDLFERYMATKKVKDTTRTNYHTMWDNRVRNEIGNMKVTQIKTSHILLFYSKLSEVGLAHNTIKYLHTMIKPSLELAVTDDIIRKNPANVSLGEYGEKPKEKEALTPAQQEKLLKFVEESNTYSHHLPMLQVMFGTCLRVSELISLTWADVDMKAKEIRITRQLVYKDLGDGYKFHDTSPKTDAGIRKIPMTRTVYRAFARQKELNLMLGNGSRVEIDGRNNFIFNSKHGRPMMPAGVNSFLKNIVNAYNKKETLLAEKEHREADLMPYISAHTLRHTGCTRLGEKHVDPKVMQYVMGHSNISVTMDVYNHILRWDVWKQRLQNWIQPWLWCKMV